MPSWNRGTLRALEDSIRDTAKGAKKRPRHISSRDRFQDRLAIQHAQDERLHAVPCFLCGGQDLIFGEQEAEATGVP